MEITFSKGRKVRLRFEELGNRLSGGFHHTVEHMNNTLMSVIVGRDQTDAVGCVDASRGIVHIDADLGLTIFRFQQLQGKQSQCTQSDKRNQLTTL